ncbi:MAG: MFS transporter [Candidatus Dormiibacterota bacterium]
MRRRLPPSLLLAFAAFAVLGLPSGVLGVAWPSLRLTFGEPLGALGLVLIANTAGYAASSALSGPGARLIGRGWLLACGSTLAALGLLGITLAPTWPALLGSYVLLGAAGGIYDGAINAQVALTAGVRTMNVLHATWGLGAAIGPQLAYGMSHSATGWRGAYAVILLCEVSLGIAFVLTHRQWDDRAEHAAAASTDGGGRGGWLLLCLSLVAFFVYTGVEVGAGQWSYSYLLGRGTPADLAALAVTGYWAALTVGRLAIVFLPRGVSPVRLVLGCLLLCVLGGVALVVTPIGLPLIALGLAPVFPTLMTLTPLRFGRGAAASVAGYQVGAATIGGGLLPAGFGLLFQARGVALLPLVLLAAVIATSALVVAGELRVRARAGTTSRPGRAS